MLPRNFPDPVTIEMQFPATSLSSNCLIASKSKRLLPNSQPPQRVHDHAPTLPDGYTLNRRQGTKKSKAPEELLQNQVGAISSATVCANEV